MFHDRLQYAIIQAKRQTKQIALLFIDLDGFKNINDTLGHSIGDELLIKVADRLRYLIRESDTFSRFGGDEFVVMLFDINNILGIELLAKKLLTALNQPFMTSKGTLNISGSIGVSLYPEHSDNGETLIQYADNAMYSAKANGRNKVCFFQPQMKQEIEQKYCLECELRKAIEKQLLQVYFQPIVDLTTLQPAGAEALLRWHHPERGFISPEIFIPIAEECGLIGQIGHWVTREACTAACQWQTVSSQPLYISINKSVQQFNSDADCTEMLTIIRSTGIDFNQVVIEITESVIMSSKTNHLMVLNSMRKLGMQVFLDDFGTGYSSLSYLKKLPVNKVKIDKSFIKDVLDDKQDADLVEAIISMSHKLGLETVAEGIETAEQMAFLQDKGCQYGQGYFFANPLPASEFLNYLNKPKKS